MTRVRLAARGTTRPSAPIIGRQRIAAWLSWALITVSLAVLAGYWADRLASFAQLEESALQEMEQRAVVLTEAVAEQARSVVYNADLGLTHLQRVFANRGVISETDAQTVRAATPPGLVRRVTIIDARGYASFSYPPLPAGRETWVGDRPHFVAHQAAGTDYLFVGHPIASRFTGEWLLPLSRRLQDVRGEFAGVATLTVAPEYFSGIFRRLAAGRHDVIALVHRDGAFLSRSHNLEQHLGKNVREDRPFIGEGGADHGVFRSYSTHEPINRVFAFRRLAEWPLVVVAGLGVDEVVAPLKASHRRDLQAASAVSALVLVLVGGVSVVLVRLERNLLRLRDTEQRLAMAISGASELAWEWDVPHRRLDLYGDCAPLLGERANVLHIDTTAWLERIHPEDRDSVRQRVVEALREASGGIELQHRARHADGRWRWVLVRGRVVERSADGRARRLIGILLDVDAAKTAEILAAQTRESYIRLIEHAAEGILVVDRDGRIEIFNPAAESLLGWAAADVLGRPCTELFHPDAGGRGIDPVADTLVDGRSRRRERIDYFRKDGAAMPVELSVAPIVLEGRISGAVAIMADVSERLAWEAELQRQARTDTLTGANNRRAFFELAQREVYRAERDGSPVSLLMMDLDRFKEINDVFGHAAGDRVLVAVVQACIDELRRIDVFGRVGGEELAAVLPGVGLREACAVAERVRERIAAMVVQHGDAWIRCTVSIGVAARQRHEEFQGLMMRADEALYLAKSGGRDRVEDSTASGV